MLNSILWTPILFGLIALLGPRRFAPWIAGVGTVVTLVLAAIVAIGFDPSGGLPVRRRRHLDSRTRHQLQPRC